MEARDGIEPPNKGFADLSLTVWVPRPGEHLFLVTYIARIEPSDRAASQMGTRKVSSGGICSRRGVAALNSVHPSRRSPEK